MRKSLIGAFALLVFAGVAHGQPPSPLVADVIDRLVNAFNNQDASQVAAIWTIDGQHTSTDSDSVMQGRAALQDSYESLFKQILVHRSRQ